ncbi:site-specific recombinase [Crenobacter sp. SG2303]|uniref:Site-specific recombinase n=1 Tax=Crenobacter oryzisoli TaxID=3056844 RepID=A0ABT7XKA8_9NEIS|nr:site-specific recombinase [Crenobacter sp. SG2303]MDN0074221.1 site-specific recombinase [Crenobacter sp. SG2303]
MNKTPLSMDDALRRLATAEHPPAEALADLIVTLRPPSARHTEQAIQNLRALTYLLEHQPDYRQALRQGLLALLTETRQIALYTETGILANEGFFTALSRRIGERLLPPPVRAESLRDVFGQLFSHKNDHQWLASIPDDAWSELWRTLAWHEQESNGSDTTTRMQMLEAVQVLSSRITAIGLEPELVRVYPDIERFESPFLHLNAEVMRYVESYRLSLSEHTRTEEDEKHILVLLDQCEDILAKLRKNAARYGISVNLTYHALRLAQHIDRLRALLILLDPDYDPAVDPTLFRLIVNLIEAENRKYSLRDLFKSNTELLALQVTEHAGRRGEHYIAETRSEWNGMARAAMGAGLIVGVMALIKMLAARGHLPLLWEGMAFGLNYAIGFIIVQILGFTIATKQPAMTAARIASAIHTVGAKAQTEELADLVVKVLRTQFVAILGNVLLVIPTAGLLALGWQAMSGQPLVDAAKAQHLLHDLDPVRSLAIPHAAIAGVYLFLSGLIAGYYDNLAIYRRIPERIAALPWLNRLIGSHRANRLAGYIENNLGALAGNFYFGMFLGLTGTVGVILGLPIDIRHITFSSAYLAFSSVTNNFQLPLDVVLTSLAGIALIGLTNLAVSFGLALWVALRSRKLRGRDALPLVPLLLRRFIRHPLQFILPPKAVPLEDEADKEQEAH